MYLSHNTYSQGDYSMIKSVPGSVSGQEDDS